MSASSASCPACAARFRGTAECSRCGADLAPVMSLAALAYHRRVQARRFLAEGDFAGALLQAREAQATAALPAGDALARVAACLAAAGQEGLRRDDERHGQRREGPAAE